MTHDSIHPSHFIREALRQFYGQDVGFVIIIHVNHETAVNTNFKRAEDAISLTEAALRHMKSNAIEFVKVPKPS